MIVRLVHCGLLLAACSSSLFACQPQQTMGPPGQPMKELPFHRPNEPGSTTKQVEDEPSSDPYDKVDDTSGASAKRLASTTFAKGLVPLSDADSDDMTFKCKPMRDKIDDAARADGKRLSREEYLDQVLAGPFKVGPQIRERCADLLRRDARVHRAQAVEGEAIENLRRIASGMASAYAKEPHALCPAAGPVPADIAAVATDLAMSKPDDWSTPGWQCARFSLNLPQRFQYAITVDLGSQSYEAVARGYPVDGTVEELYVRASVEDGRLSGAVDVLRR